MKLTKHCLNSNLKQDKKRAFCFRVACTTPGFEDLVGVSREFYYVSKHRTARQRSLGRIEAYIENPIVGGDPIPYVSPRMKRKREEEEDDE